MRICPVQFHQFLMVSPLDDSALLQHIDAVSHDRAGQSVGNEYDRLILCRFQHCLIQLILADRVKGAGWLIQYDDGTVLIKRPCYGHLLGFPSGQVHSLRVKFPGKGSLDAARKRCKALCKTALFQRLFNLFLIRCFYPSDASALPIASTLFEAPDIAEAPDCPTLSACPGAIAAKVSGFSVFSGEWSQ